MLSDQRAVLAEEAAGYAAGLPVLPLAIVKSFDIGFFVAAMSLIPRVKRNGEVSAAEPVTV